MSEEQNVSEETSIKSVQEILGWMSGKKLIIPNLQRDYVWGREEWKRLWDDIIQVLNKIEAGEEKAQHFTGVITFKKEEDDKEKDTYSVLDGQQRLTTLSVLLDYLNYFMEEKPQKSSMDFFKSKLEYEKDPMNSLNDRKNKYIEIYSYFMDCHLEINYENADKLRDIVLNRLFLLVHVTDENPHEVFEGLNATGKKLEFSDLILNALLEEGDPSQAKDIKDNWSKFLGKICGTKTITFEDEEAECITIEEVTVAPLKLKKYFNAIYSMTIGENTSMYESVTEFNRILDRLGELESKFLTDKESAPALKSTPKSTSIEKIETLNEWADIYLMIIDPVSKYDAIREKAYAKELYYLSLWNNTAFIPTLMRILYRNVKLTPDNGKYYSEKKVKDLLKSILTVVVYTRIILNRLHADDRNVENQIRYLDYIFDACCELNKSQKYKMKNLGEDFQHIFYIVNGFANIAEEFSKADDIIRNYQYTSSGSKFLLALLVDEKDDEKNETSKVCRMEKDWGKAQVEHMVSQNLAEGTFDDYGYDVSSIGLLDNLMLLSAGVNQAIGDKKPEDKFDSWTEDKFGRLFVQEELCKLRKARNWTQIGTSQSGKVNAIIKAFKNYFCFTGINHKAAFKEYTFACKSKKNGYVEKLEGCFKNSCVNGNQDTQYLRISGKGVYEEHPKRKENRVVEFWTGCDGNNITAFKPDDDTVFSYTIMKEFIKKMDDKDGRFYQWLQDCEKRINNLSKGSNEVTSNNKTFTYSQKMIHTGYLEENEDARKTIMGRAEKKRRNGDKNNNVINENNTYYLSNDFNIIAIINNLQVLYNNYLEEQEASEKFAFWVKVTDKAPVFIGNVLIQTEYINIGDYGLYCDWIKKQYKDIFKPDEDAEQKPDVNGEGLEERYFKNERCSFMDIIKCGKPIKIPEYQRAYVWDEANWEALYKQLSEKKSQNKSLFLGTVVIREEDNTLFIVDGQQRLTTLAGFWLALKQGQDLPEPQMVQELKNNISKNNALKKIFDFIKNKEQDKKIDSNDKLAGEDINCEFDVLYINGPREYQYEVFSSINSAGKKLTEEEKIANFLFSEYQEADADAVKLIAYNPGFAKAFCECVTEKFCDSKNIYFEYKKILETSELKFEQLDRISNIYRYIKGEKKQKCFGKKYPVWLELINMLEVSTADALLLHWTIRLLKDVEDGYDPDDAYAAFDLLTKKVCILYFLLYVMDRSGNAKKSANDNFLKCISLSDEKSLAATVISSQADQPYWSNGAGIQHISEKIWEKYVTTLPIYDIGQARIKRFILLMLEYMMIDEKDYTLKQFAENVDNQAQLDIEHIFPSSNKQCPEGCNPIPVNRLNYLENVMLLETNINKTVKDKMLVEQDKDGKITEKGKIAEYTESTCFMAKLLCSQQGDNHKQVYDLEFAECRMETLQDMIVPRLQDMLALVLDQSGEGIPQNAQNAFDMIKIKVTGKTNAKNKSKRKTRAATGKTQETTGTKNLRCVMEYAAQNALEYCRKSGGSKGIDVSKCRTSACEKIADEMGMERKYITTINSQLTRGLGIKSAKDVDQALLALWKGESKENNEALGVMLDRIGEMSDSLKHDLEAIKEYFS